MLLMQPEDIVKWNSCCGEKILGKLNYSVFCLYKVNNIVDNFYLGNSKYK